MYNMNLQVGKSLPRYDAYSNVIDCAKGTEALDMYDALLHWYQLCAERYNHPHCAISAHFARMCKTTLDMSAQDLTFTYDVGNDPLVAQGVSVCDLSGSVDEGGRMYIKHIQLRTMSEEV